MCGLVGAFAFEETTREELEIPIKALMTRIARRGPDDEGFWTDVKRCALGFRRLAILDLTPTGHQPMHSRDGRYTLVFNGEIYNFRDVRDELVRRGREFRSTGDAEVLLVALEEWGVDALPRLNGMFALALHDARDQRLLLARDHAGIKPLHFARTQRGVVFASQYDQLLAHPWCRSLAPSQDGLGLYLRFGFVPAPYGLHRDTAQVEAGQWVEFSSAGERARGRHFDLPRSKRPTFDGVAALDAFDAAFVRAIKRHLESDVPVGVFLSGGIDSPLVVAETRRQTTSALKAFTIGLDDPAYDESADARAYARELGVEHVVEMIDANAVVSLFDDVVAASTEPTADFSMFPTLLVSRLARRELKVVLSGDGGDELYWGYPGRFGSAIEQARYFGWPRAARIAAIAARRVVKWGAATRDTLRFESLGRLYQRKHTLTAESDLAAIFPTLPPVPSSFHDFDFEGTDPDEAAQWVRWNEFRIHLARVLAKVDRASMYNSLEVRVPLLDKEVIEVAWATDWHACLDVETRVGKRVLRQALAKRTKHHTAAKKGFTVPMHEWLCGPLRPKLRELVLDRDQLLGLPLAKTALRDVDAAMVAGDRSKAWGMWLLLSLALWERTYGAAT